MVENCIKLDFGCDSLESIRYSHQTKMAVFEQKTYNKVVLDDTVPLTCTIEAAHNVKDHTVSTDQ